MIAQQLQARPRDVLAVLIERQLRLSAKRASLGLIWPLIAPLFLLALYFFVFGRVFDVPIPDYPVYLFAGLLPWSLAAQSLGSALLSISSEPELVRKARFPYELLPIARVGAMATYFFATLIGFVGYLAIAGRLNLVVLPLIIVPTISLLLLVSGIALAFGLMDVYNRDMRAILANLLTVWFFLAPIVYRPQMLPGYARPLLAINPMSQIVAQFRGVLYWGEVPDVRYMTLTLVACGAMFALALGVFRRFSHNLAKDI